jgi:hypothetical protein
MKANVDAFLALALGKGTRRFILHDNAQALIQAVR